MDSSARFNAAAMRSASGPIGVEVEGHQAGGGIEQHGVAGRPGAPARTCADDGGVRHGVPAAQLLQRRLTDAELARVEKSPR